VWCQKVGGQQRSYPILSRRPDPGAARLARPRHVPEMPSGTGTVLEQIPQPEVRLCDFGLPGAWSLLPIRWLPAPSTTRRTLQTGTDQAPSGCLGPSGPSHAQASKLRTRDPEASAPTTRYRTSHAGARTPVQRFAESGDPGRRLPAGHRGQASAWRLACSSGIGPRLSPGPSQGPPATPAPANPDRPTTIAVGGFYTERLAEPPRKPDTLTLGSLAPPPSILM